jgi:hypothetical protein
MADDEGRQDREDLSQDPFVERMRPDPSEPPEQVRILEGLLGDSDREGYRRLYFTRELDYYAEFRTEDVVFSETIPSDQPPFLGQQATRVGIRRNATVEFTRLRAHRPVDEFDLDVRLSAPGGGRGAAAQPFVIWATRSPAATCPNTRCNQPDKTCPPHMCTNVGCPQTIGERFTCNHPRDTAVQCTFWTCFCEEPGRTQWTNCKPPGCRTDVTICDTICC